jgi:hypothetical protein
LDLISFANGFVASIRFLPRSILLDNLESEDNLFTF